MSWLKQNGAGLQNEVIYFPMIFMCFSSVVSPSLPYPAKQCAAVLPSFVTVEEADLQLQIRIAM